MMLADQDNKCAGCGKPDPEHVDHDHVTGDVRGMLCFNCNQALGNVRDSYAVLENLQDYLLATSPTLAEIPVQEIRNRGKVYELDGWTPHSGVAA